MRYLMKIESASGYSLPESLVMLDCEMTGVVPKRDHLLQVAALKLTLKGNQYQVEGEPFIRYLHYSGRPTNAFHKKYLSHIFDLCNKSNLTPEQLKSELHAWLGPLKGKVMPTGDCVSTDLAFLVEKGCADVGDVNDDGPIPGTFHYETFEIHPIKEIARTLVGMKDIEIENYDHEHIHDALVDCKNQTLELNAFIRILLNGPIQKETRSN